MAEFEQMLGETRKLLEQVRSGAAAAPGEADTPPLEGFGEAADGRIRVTAGQGGEIKGIELDPRVMRMASEELAEHLTVAVNAALTDLRSRATTSDTPIDPSVLADRLQEVQDQGLRQMGLFAQGLEDAMARFKEAGSGRGTRGG
ncbi:YbaB/EbfC family nucleoid-associated protein [Thermomonospora umbrina]|nr:YbaB/EbfC family nucleoid-associated protein [Thermomonospora umbrina]